MARHDEFATLLGKYALVDWPYSAKAKPSGEKSTELRKSLCTWLRECFRQVQAEVKSNRSNKLHQTTYEDFFSALYITDVSREGKGVCQFLTRGREEGPKILKKNS